MFAINFQVQESIYANSWESSHYSLLNFKCSMTNHATFDTQLDHVAASHVNWGCFDLGNLNQFPTVLKTDVIIIFINA